MRLLAALLLCAGCGKELNPKFCAAHPDDERCTGADAAVDAFTSPFPVAHLPVATELMLTSFADVTISVPTTIDTSAGTITPALTGALILGDVAQDSGPNVMVIQVGSLDIGDVITVVGTRPLVIVAARTLRVGADIDVSATGQTPGPAGSAFGMGMGAGAEGTATGQTGDGGGGGGSYGTLGGRGGNPTGGAAGALYGSSAILQGGSGGGAPSTPASCVVRGGAGGGAIQLTALVSLTIDGQIHAGGSAGEGGLGCSSDGSGGGGGGSGGMIALKAPLLLGSGLVGANGGGGSEGASQGGTYTGVSGSDASTVAGGTAGTSSNTGGNGGSGAMGTTPGGDGGDVNTDNNGGGGGGGGGRIYYLTPGAQPAYAASPPATSG